MQKFNKKINIFISNLKIIYFLNIIILYVSNSTLEEVQKGLKEVVYSYYMRGKLIQYNSAKITLFSPEEATEQNRNFLVCSGLTSNVYRELLNITIPSSSGQLLSYSLDNIGSPEVIAYSYLNNNKIREMKIYYPNNVNKYKIITNPSIKDVIPLVQIGDILTYTGHTFLIYDIEKDSNNEVIDAIIMESTGGIGRSYVNTKIARQQLKINGNDIKFYLYFLYLNSKLNSNFEEGLIQGSVGLKKLSTYSTWVKISNNSTDLNYSILRFVQSDSKGNAILKYKTIYPKKPNQFLMDDKIELSNKNIDRIKKFNHIYIEKVVNKNNNNVVELGDILNYKIIIKNLHSKDYDDDLIIIENLSKFITYEIHYENKEIISFEYDIKNQKLLWNIGKLKKGDIFIINYLVKVTSGKPKDIIESTGFVGNIPSSIIKNVIGVNLDKSKMDLIKKNFEKLKNKYSGKQLINEIYKESFDVDIKFNEFDITKLINNTKLNLTSYSSIYLNKNNIFYNAVLNKYWSSLVNIKYTYIKGGEEVNIYSLKGFRDYNDPERREDFIYLETFKTGDILIYINRNDITYEINNNKLNKNYISYEQGEYAYIYIEDKGFIGVNLGDDGIKNTKDDRNEFNAKYYKDNNLTLYTFADNPSDEILEMANVQTLFGKDYYVILRPSLCFNFPDNNNNIIIILSIIIIILILVFGLFIIYKYIKMKKSGKEFTFKNLKEELL